MRLTMQDHVGAGQRIMPGAFDKNIGKTIPIRLEDGTALQGEVVGAAVADDGRTYSITVEIPEPVDPDTVQRFGSIFTR